MKPIKLLYFFALTLLGCDSVKTIYKSPQQAKSYYTIRVVNLSHCGCNDLYVDHYKAGIKDFMIFYNEKIARKTIYDHNSKKNPAIVQRLLATKENMNLMPFDQLDAEIFNKIDSLTAGSYLHKLHRPGYKGYIKDTLLFY